MSQIISGFGSFWQWLQDHLNHERSTNVLISAGASNSASFQVSDRSAFVGLLIPNITAGAVGLQMSEDNLTWYPIIDPLDGDDVVIMASGADPGYVDISDLVKALPADMHLRISCAVQGGAAIMIVYEHG